jgi:hypothetical protein
MEFLFLMAPDVHIVAQLKYRVRFVQQRARRRSSPLTSNES